MDTSDIIETYNNAAVEYARNRLGHEPKKELAQFLALLKPGAKVLDVGCAAGRDTRIIKDHGVSATGVDLSDKLLAIAKRGNPDIPFMLADMRDLPFGNAEFDAVWANAILHHVDQKEMAVAIKEFTRVLKPGGILCARTKMGEGQLTTRDEIVQDQKRSFTLLTADKLNKLLIAAGLTKLELTTSKSKSREGLYWLTATYKK